MKLGGDHEGRLRLGLNLAVLLGCLIYAMGREPVAYQTTPFENFMIGMFAPLQKGINSLKDRMSYIAKSYRFNVIASKENIVMRQKVEELKNELFTLQEVAQENRRLKKLLHFGQKMSSKKVLARVVAWDAAGDSKVLRIDRGANDGITLQATVLTNEGLVGYVYRLTDNFADVLTILDSNNRIDGIISRIRSHGIVEGYTSGKCVMKHVTRTEPIILHDAVFTSGLGNVYPKGVRIGSVTRIEREGYGITQYIEITPYVDFGKIEEVFVLVAEDSKRRQKELQLLDSLDKSEKGGSR